MVRAFGTKSLLLVSLAVVALTGTSEVGLTQQPQRGKPAAPTTSTAPAQAPTVQRSETTQFNSWRVTCTETDVSKRKACSAVLNGLDQNRRTVLTWIMGRNNEGALVTVLQTPQTQLGLNIQKGVELKLGNGNPRKLDYMVCNQARCESVLPMDDAMTRELGSVTAASVTIYRADGQPITINLPSITGADKALSTIGRG
jgi:invasion protein IalB